MDHRKSGFTLVEMIVTIAVSSLICIAATTLLISNLRLTKALTNTSQSQLAVSLINEVMRDISTQNNIKVEDDIIKLNGNDFLSFEAAEECLKLNSTEYLDNVTGFVAEPKGDHLLYYKITVKQAGGPTDYEGYIYCPNAILT